MDRDLQFDSNAARLVIVVSSTERALGGRGLEGGVASRLVVGFVGGRRKNQGPKRKWEYLKDQSLLFPLLHLGSQNGKCGKLAAVAACFVVATLENLRNS